MSARAALVLRPEPGNAATRARLAAVGIDSVALPLFATRALAWDIPDPARFDALLFTSAHAVRLAGSGLAVLAHLPVLAIGDATAAAVRDAGLAVAITGDRDAAHLVAVARAAGCVRPLHLAGREHHSTGAATIAVYGAEPLAVAPATLAAVAADASVALIHSPRAARHFAGLIDAAALPREALAIAALSPAILAAAGEGWRWAISAASPCDPALITLVRRRLTALARGGISGT